MKYGKLAAQMKTAESMLLLVPFATRHKYRSSTFEDR